MDAAVRAVSTQPESRDSLGEKKVCPTTLLPQAIKAVFDNQECQIDMVYNTLRVVLPQLTKDKGSDLQDAARE